MNINIRKEDLWTIRHVCSQAVWQMENCPNPSACGDQPKIIRRLNRKLTRALKKVNKNYNSHGIHQ